MGASGLVRFVILAVIMVATAVALALLTNYGYHGEPTRICGMLLVGLGAGEPAILLVGGGAGIIVVGGGVGVVAFTWIGGGLLFATGQAAVGAIAVGQVGLGLTFFAGQAGTGAVGVAQGMLGAEVATQGHAGGKPFLDDLNHDLGRLLALRRRPPRVESDQA